MSDAFDRFTAAFDFEAVRPDVRVALPAVAILICGDFQCEP
jgi:hypothetical protein